jgi:hypothetical protein
VVTVSKEFPKAVEDLKILSTARCARTSYTQPEDGKVIDLETAKRIYSQTLMASSNAGDPKHLSPLEHVACAMDNSSFVGNFKGFKQFRKEVE